MRPEFGPFGGAVATGMATAGLRARKSSAGHVLAEDAACPQAPGRRRGAAGGALRAALRWSAVLAGLVALVDHRARPLTLRLGAAFAPLASFRADLAERQAEAQAQALAYRRAQPLRRLLETAAVAGRPDDRPVLTVSLAAWAPR